MQLDHSCCQGALQDYFAETKASTRATVRCRNPQKELFHREHDLFMAEVNRRRGSVLAPIKGETFRDAMRWMHGERSKSDPQGFLLFALESCLFGDIHDYLRFAEATASTWSTLACRERREISVSGRVSVLVHVQSPVRA
jgi:hypothetical protein